VRVHSNSGRLGCGLYFLDLQSDGASKSGLGTYDDETNSRNDTLDGKILT
jgi:hypothetical protein